MKAEELVVEISNRIEIAVRDMLSYSLTHRRNEEKLILKVVEELKSAARGTENWSNAANFSAYVIDIKGNLRELCKPKTKYYRGDDYHLIEIIAAMSKIQHPTCLNIRQS